MAKLTESGKWYLVVSCSGCGEPIPFAEAPSPDEQPGSDGYHDPRNNVFGTFATAKANSS
jgi:hypothetical protein